MKILHIDSSLNPTTSHSRALSAHIVQEMLSTHPHVDVTYVDLCKDPVQHLTQEDFAHFLENAYLKDFLDHDCLVIGAPMYNFTIPSVLKAWLDRLAVAGVTFRYTEKGPEGLMGHKKVVIASSRGGIYSTPPLTAFDHQENYLIHFFQFLGITDITVRRLEGVALGQEAVQKAYEAEGMTLKTNT